MSDNPRRSASCSSIASSDSDESKGNDTDSDWAPEEQNAETSQLAVSSLQPPGSCYGIINEVDALQLHMSDHNYSALSDEDDAHLATENVPRSSSRKYCFINRAKAPPKGPSRKEKWLGNFSNLTEQKVRGTHCCKRLRCFKGVQYSFLLEQGRRVLTASTTTRRSILRSFITSKKEFLFDGKQVCIRFLKKSFRFGSDMIGEVRKPPEQVYEAVSSTTTTRTSNARQNLSLSSEQTTRNSSEDDLMHRRKKEAILSFMYRLADDCGDMQPDRKEVQLPFHQRKEVYPVFSQDFEHLYPSVQPVSPQYFRLIWKEHCPEYKVMRSQRFATCEECDRLRAAVKEFIVSGQSTESIKVQCKAHLDFIFRERLEYQTKKDKARLQGHDFVSVIIDGADQSAFSLPHFTTKPKSQRGHALKVKLIGLLEHRMENQLTFFTMTEDHSTGSNHIVDVLHRFINSKRAERSLPRKFFVQLDNCSRENRNRFVLSYLEMLVSVGVFETIEVGFLPVGHTHEDVDQCFSQKSARLRVHNAITLEDLHQELRQTKKQRVQVHRMNRVGNWSGLCVQENCLMNVDRITQWRYFSFVRDPTCSHEVGEKPLWTKCFVKRSAVGQWQDLFSDRSTDKRRGILRQCPDLRKTPSLQINCPDGVSEITKRLISEEGRINDADKFTTLSELRDFVFDSRVDHFHWRLSECIESEFCGLYLTDSCDGDNTTNTSRPSTSTRDIDTPRNPNVAQQAGSVPQRSGPPNSTSKSVTGSVPKSSPSAGTPRNRVEYDMGSFLLVKHDGAAAVADRNIWVARAVEVFASPSNNYAKEVRVHWYERTKKTDDGREILQAAFNPCFLPQKRKRKRSSAKDRWLDTVHNDTVAVSFPSLTSRKTLPLAVQNKISR